MADPQLTGLICERGDVAQARAANRSQYLVAEKSFEDFEGLGPVVVLYYHSNPEESRLPGDKEELRLLRAEADTVEFVPDLHPVYTERSESQEEESEEVSEPPEPPQATKGQKDEAAIETAKSTDEGNAARRGPTASVEPPNPHSGTKQG